MRVPSAPARLGTFRSTFVEAFGQRFRRTICGRCSFFCVALGEAVRVDRAEGGFEVLHVCLSCVRRARPAVAPAGRGQMRRAA